MFYSILLNDRGHLSSALSFVQQTNLLVLQKCLTHTGAEVQLPLQVAYLLLPVTGALSEGELRSPAQVLLPPCTSGLACSLVQAPGLLLLFLFGLSLGLGRRMPTTLT